MNYEHVESVVARFEKVVAAFNPDKLFELLMVGTDIRIPLRLTNVELTILQHMVGDLEHYVTCRYDFELKPTNNSIKNKHLKCDCSNKYNKIICELRVLLLFMQEQLCNLSKIRKKIFSQDRFL